MEQQDLLFLLFYYLYFYNKKYINLNKCRDNNYNDNNKMVIEHGNDNKTRSKWKEI